jgi:hypothetical protein
MSNQDAKEVEFYAANVNAWLNTKLELDKSLLTLSAGGIGLLITLLTTVGIKSKPIFVLYIFALVFFVVTLFSVLFMLGRNSHYVEKVLNGSNNDDPVLNIFDGLARICFVVGVILSSIIGVSMALQSINWSLQ